MIKLKVEKLAFEFPSGWAASKFDDWAFYRNQFSGMRQGIKAVDLVALEPGTRAGATAWFIEVKDYRVHPRSKPSDLPDEIARKVFDTLAALLPAKANANEPVEKKMAGSMLTARKIRVVLHLEQPKRHSKLFPRVIDPADVAMKLKRLIRPIDPHPIVSEIGRMSSLQWSVE